MSRRDFGIPGVTTGREYKDEWLTPPSIVRALGEFDLDPCAPVDRPWDTAAHHFTIEDDGLRQDWSRVAGRVWLNPPYSNAHDWLERLVCHGDGIALLFARTDTAAFFRLVWSQAQAVLFIKDRLRFFYANGTESPKNGGAPSVLIAYGEENARVLVDAEASGRIAGQVVTLGPAGVVAIRRQPRLPLARRSALRVLAGGAA